MWQSADPIIGKYLDGAVNGVYESSNLAFYTYGRNNPVILKDPDGNIVPLLVGAWMVVEAGLTAYDVYTAGDTLLDENASTADKSIAVGGLIVGAVLPGGGYGAAGKEVAEQTVKAANRAENAVDATALVAKGGDDTVEVFRVFGGDARAEGFSWTTVDPRTVSDFRDAAGLPSGGASGATNTADFLLMGEAKAADIIKSRSALPLDGNKGGLPELIIDPKDVNITDFSVLNP